MYVNIRHTVGYGDMRCPSEGAGHSKATSRIVRNQRIKKYQHYHMPLQIASNSPPPILTLKIGSVLSCNRLLDHPNRHN